MQVLLVFLTFGLWSSIFSIGKIGLEASSPLFLTAVRLGLAGLLILIYLKVSGKSLKISKGDLIPLLLYALFAMYIANALEFWGLQYLTAAKACFIYSLSPFITCILSYLQFKERISFRKILGLTVGIIGFLPIMVGAPGAEELLAGNISFLSLAELALIGATLASAYGWVLLRSLGKERSISPLLSNAYAMTIGSVFALIHSGITEVWAPIPVTSGMDFIGAVFVMIIVSNLICYNLYGHLLKKYTATFLSFAGLMTPVFAALFGWVLLRETVSWSFFISTAIIGVGLWIVHAEELRLGYILKKQTTP